MNVTNIAIGVCTGLFSAFISQKLYDLLVKQLKDFSHVIPYWLYQKKTKSIFKFSAAVFIFLWFGLYILCHSIFCLFF